MGSDRGRAGISGAGCLAAGGAAAKAADAHIKAEVEAKDAAEIEQLKAEIGRLKAEAEEMVKKANKLLLIIRNRDGKVVASIVGNNGEGDLRTEGALAAARPSSMAARMRFTVSARPTKIASPTRKWPMLSSTTWGKPAIIRADS